MVAAGRQDNTWDAVDIVKENQGGCSLTLGILARVLSDLCGFVVFYRKGLESARKVREGKFQITN